MEIDLKDLEKEQKLSIANQDLNSASDRATADQLYLGKIKFKSKLRRGWLNFFVSRPRVIFLLIAFLVVLGFYSYQALPRESSPEVKIPYAAVIATYPGASPTDVEELVTKRLESGISGIKGVKQISSESSNSVSMITVEFGAKENLDDALRKLRDEVNSLSGRLPAEVSEPIVQEISADDSPIWVFTLSGAYDRFTLRDFAEDIKEELEKVSGIREVLVSGGDERQFSIDYDSSKLAFYNLSPTTANSAVVMRNSAIPVGVFDGERYSYSIRTDAQPSSLEDLRNTPLSHTADGAIIYLKDVALVQETALKKTSLSRLSQEGSVPQESISFQVIKKTGGNIIEIVDEGEARLETKLKNLPAGLSYATTLDMSDMIEKDFNQLAGDFSLTIILVFTILFLIVGFKEALVAGLAIPLVFFGTFAVMLFSGISLNFLSLYGLILSLGLLVDDAIVVVSATKQYLKSGKFTPEEAVLLVLNDFKVVLTASTLTTVWAFLPLLLATGIMGEYLKSIPITISTTLILSLIIALIINHPLAAVLERIRFGKGLFFSVFIGLLLIAFWAGVFGGPAALVITILILAVLGAAFLWYFKGGRLILKKNSELMAEESFDDNKIKEKLIKQSSATEANFFTRLFHGIISFDKVLPVYEKYLRPIIEKSFVRKRFLAFVVFLFFIALSLPLAGILKYEFFPKTDLEYITIDIKAPHGLKLSETDKITQEVEKRLLTYPEISNFSTVVGGSGSLSYFSGAAASSQANITIRLKPLKERSLKSYELADLWSEDFKDIVGAELTVSALAAGPPTGADFEVQIHGPDLQELERITFDLEEILKEIDGVASTNDSLEEAQADYTFILNPERLELYDLNAAYVGGALRLAVSGSEVTTVLNEGEEIKVTAKVAENKLDNLSSLQNLQLSNLKGQNIFLKDVATIKLEPAAASISRVDGERSITLSAKLTATGNSATVLEEFQARIKNYDFPDDYQVVYGGASQEITESTNSLVQAMGVSLLLIIITLVIQFNSFRQVLIIVAAIPLALIGVSFGLSLIRVPMSLPGLIGVLGLFGIVVKNAIILVDKINLNLRTGIPYNEAIIDAGKSRLEAIFITSMSTILGLLPITISSEMWRGLGSAIISGLLLSALFTLFVVPALYVVLIKPKRKKVL